MGDKPTSVSDPLPTFEQDLLCCTRRSSSFSGCSLKRIGLATIGALGAVVALASWVDVHGGTPEVTGAQIGNSAGGQSSIQELAGHGLTPSLEWDADIFVNARGGRTQGAVVDGLVKLGLDIDGQKLTGLGLLSNTDIHVEGRARTSASSVRGRNGPFSIEASQSCKNSPLAFARQSVTSIQGSFGLSAEGVASNAPPG